MQTQNLVASCYTHLIEQMHVALNSKLDVRCDDEELEERENFKDLWIRAEEACEFEDYDKADQLFVTVSYIFFFFFALAMRINVIL